MKKAQMGHKALWAQGVLPAVLQVDVDEDVLFCDIHNFFQLTISLTELYKLLQFTNWYWKSCQRKLVKQLQVILENVVMKRRPVIFTLVWTDWTVCKLDWFESEVASFQCKVWCFLIHAQGYPQKDASFVVENNCSEKQFTFKIVCKHILYSVCQILIKKCDYISAVSQQKKSCILFNVKCNQDQNFVLCWCYLY